MTTKRHVQYLKNYPAKIAAKRLKRRRMLAKRPESHSLHYMQSVLRNWSKSHPQVAKAGGAVKTIARRVKKAVIKKPTV